MDSVSRRVSWLTALVLAVVSLVTYYPGLRLGFYLDDYVYIERAGRTGGPDVLAQLFDPRLQTQWYRPLQAIQFLVQYRLFGGNSDVYHLINMTFHVINVLLLFLILRRFSGKWLIGLAGAFLFATFSVYPSAVNWVGIVDPLNTMFYLLSIWFWLEWLERGSPVHYAFSFVAFVLALLSKQISVTIPIVLFLIEWWLLRRRITPGRLVRTYGPFAAGGVAFLCLQYLTQSTHTFASVFGWQLGATMLYILVQYLVLFFFPWGVFPSIDFNQVQVGTPVTYLWVAIALCVFAFVAWRRKSRALAFLAAFALMNLLPVLPFPFIENRYLYLPIMSAAALLALMVQFARQQFGGRPWFVPLAAVLLSLLSIGNGWSVNDSALSAAEWARQLRVPFRDVARAHPTLPDNTLLYFIDPITPTTGGLSGMAMVQYGKGVWVKNWTEYAELGKYDTAYVYYFDETRLPHEIVAEKNAAPQISLPLPVSFQDSIRLTGYEVPQTVVERGSPIVLMLYWQAVTKMDRDYSISIRLVSPAGTAVAQYQGPPRKGQLPTSQWDPSHYVADSILLPVGSEVPPGAGYRIEVGWFDPQSQQRLSVVGGNGLSNGDTIVIQPFSVR